MHQILSRLWNQRLSCFFVLFFPVCFTGCGTGSGGPFTTTPVSSGAAITIQTQPQSLSLPMGLDASFQVVATGSLLNYQWYRNGVAISGASGKGYTLPAAAFTDSDSVFTVKVSNTAGSVTSAPATLTITARAPKAGDLRFQQVDAPTTVNGYTGYEQTNLLARGGIGGTNLYGTPLYTQVGACSATPSGSGLDCGWELALYGVPVAIPTFSTSYRGGYYLQLQDDLQSTTFPVLQTGTSVLSADTVITSVSLSPVNNLYAMSYIRGIPATGNFNAKQNVVAPAALGMRLHKKRSKAE